MPSEPRRQTTSFICECQPTYLLFLMPSALIYTNPPFKQRGNTVFFKIVTTNFGEMDSKLNPMASTAHSPLDSLRLYTKVCTCVGIFVTKKTILARCYVRVRVVPWHAPRLLCSSRTELSYFPFRDLLSLN